MVRHACRECAAEVTTGRLTTRWRRPVDHRGRPVLAMDCALAGAEAATCPAAQLGRYTSS